MPHQDQTPAMFFPDSGGFGVAEFQIYLTRRQCPVDHVIQQYPPQHQGHLLVFLAHRKALHTFYRRQVRLLNKFSIYHDFLSAPHLQHVAKFVQGLVVVLPF